MHSSKKLMFFDDCVCAVNMFAAREKELLAVRHSRTSDWRSLQAVGYSPSNAVKKAAKDEKQECSAKIP